MSCATRRTLFAFALAILLTTSAIAQTTPTKLDPSTAPKKTAPSQDNRSSTSLSIIAPTVISVLAFAVSIFVLWTTHFRPFKSHFVISSPRLRLYRIDATCAGETKGDGWWIPSVDLGISIHNSGSQPGTISDLRFVFTGRRGVQYLYPKWIVDYAKFQAADGRFEMIKESVQTDWYSTLIFPKSSVSQHVVFEGARWMTIECDHFTIKLEHFSDKRSRWMKVDSFDFCIDDWEKGELEKGSSFHFGTWPDHRDHDTFDDEDRTNDVA